MRDSGLPAIVATKFAPYPWRFSARTLRGALDASLRRLLCDLIEEYGRHTGHADLLREAVDGVVGEDPPEGWRPPRALLS